MTILTPPFSRRNRVLLLVGFLCLLISFTCAIFVAASDENAQPSATATSPSDGSTKAKIAERFGKLPISFEINKGQNEPAIKFLSRGPGYELFLSATDAVLMLRKPHAPVDKFKPLASSDSTSEAEVREGSVLRLRMIGANADPRVEGQDELPGKVNYFVGNNPDKWRHNIPTYRKVHYKDVYPGIDVVYYGNQRELEYDFVVAAGANPKVIRFRVEGAERIRLDKSGNLLLTLKHGEVQLHKPSLYQLTDAGNRREIKGEYVINGNEIRFKVQDFDANKQLVIDPVLSYATFLGGAFGDQASGIAVDSQGNAYVTGSASLSFGFPTTPGAFKTTSNSGGAFISKLNPTGTNLVYSTFLVSNGNSDGRAIAVDSSGNAHVTGSTSGDDFPVVNGLKTIGTFFKTSDAAANWNNRNTGLIGSVNAIAVAKNEPNTIYAASTAGIHRSADAGATWTKPAGTGLSGIGFVGAMAVHPTNSSVVFLCPTNGSLFKTTDAGNSWSLISTIPLNSNFVFSIVFDPATPSTMYAGAGNGVFKSTDGGATWTPQNNFGLLSPPSVRALAINPTAPATIYAGTSSNGLFKTTNGGASWSPMNSGMGGNNPNNINAVVIDPANPLTIYTGHGSSGGINKSTNGATSWAPVNNGVPSFQVNAMAATSDAVYAATAGGGLIKTTNGGTNWTSANAGLGSSQVRTVVAHPGNSTTLYAGTNSNSLSDAFVAKLNASGSALLFSTLLGGSSTEAGNGIALDNSGNIYVVGQTNSTNFPAVNAVQSTASADNNCGNGFATKINPALPSYVFSTYLGGNGCDFANAVDTDAAGNAYLTGSTSSSDFPTANAFQPAISVQFSPDAFVTKLTSTGSLSYSTYLGGNGGDTGHAIAVDISGNAFITGVTGSSNFPTQNPIQLVTNADHNGDVFVTKLNAAGTGLIYSTYLAGFSTDIGRGIAIDSAGNAYVTGITRSIEFPITQGSLRTKSAVYKSIDTGANWANDNYGLTAGSVTSIAVHPTLPWTLYAGTSQGVYKSTNGGRNWSPINNGLGNVNVRTLLINPLAPSNIYVLGNSNTNNNGVWKSTDGGDSWNLRVNGMGSTFLTCLAIDPVTPNTLYAGFLGGPGSHFYKTTDGADNWAPIGNEPPSTPVSLAVDPLNHTTVYAAESSSAGGVFKSLDAGATWQPVGLSQTGAHAAFVIASPHTSGLLFTQTNLGVFKSVDGGNNWATIPVPTGGKMVFDPVSPTTLYLLSSTSGVFRSTNLGQTWSAINKGLNHLVASDLAIAPFTPSTLHLVSMSNGLNEAFVTKINPAGSALVYSTLIGGTSPSNSTPTEAAGFAIAIDPAGSIYITGTASAEVFPTTPNAFQPLMRGGSDAFIAKLVNSYIISGTVLENGVVPSSGAEVVLNDGVSLTSVMTEGDGSYEFSRLREGGNFTVSAAKPHFTMTPPSQTFNNLSSNQTLNFTAATSDAPFHTVGGKVTNNGVGLTGVTVTLTGSQVGVRTTDSNGDYSFELRINGNYTVTPALLGFTFNPPGQTFNNLLGPQTANFAATRQDFVVTNTNNQGNGSLRAAIINANATVGVDRITFNIPGPGVKIISLVNALPEITEAVVIDASTQPGYAGKPLIELDGIAVGSFNAFVIRAGGTTVRGFAIGRFTNGLAAIWIRDCDNNVIQGNHIGVDASGAVSRSNARGILLSNSSSNLIGGTTAAARNVISGNSFDGVELGGTNNTVQGNFIGTNAAGTDAIPNGINGIAISSSPFINNVIGGTAPGAGNLISGNQRGISSNAPGTIIQGNLIGTDVTGTKKVPNGFGVEAGGANVLIGGLTASARNIISGNSQDGVAFGGDGSKLQGNYIGTDITGILPLGNGGSGVTGGVNALIGGTVPGARNVIAANQIGISLAFNSSATTTAVQGNYIGTDATGNRALGNAISGISVQGSGYLIGGLVSGAGNVISGNLIGIQLGVGFSNPPLVNTIQGNLIGLNALGIAALPNTLTGIDLSGSNNNIIGGTQSGAANRIAFNGGPGIQVTSGTGNSIRRNSIFSNAGLGIDLGGSGFPPGGNGVTANDPNDPDVGPNNLQNFPLLTSVMAIGGNTTIQGSLNSTPNTTFQIDFYSSAALDPSGNGEGAQFLSSTAVTTNASGNATINVTFPVALGTGRVVTATATDPNGNTSEFSAGDATGAAGNVQFSVSSIQVIEDVGLLNVTVVRNGGSAGTLTVDYLTTNGTATAGQDYTATSGTLTFSSGETSKTIQIPILDDATTEPDETFTVALRNTPLIDSLGAASTLLVTIQDRTTVPFLSLANSSVIEGDPGTTTQVSLTLNLSAATGRAVRANFVTSDIGAFGGTTCNTRGVDYVSASGTVTVNPGTTSVVIPITICGDTNAEANESFVVTLSNPIGATLANVAALVAITNDDVLQLILEESGPTATQAAALDALLMARDPFRIIGIPEWWPTQTDRNTRVILFAKNLELNPGESPSAVIVRIAGVGAQFFDVPAEDVSPIHNFEFTQVKIRLPNNLPVGTRNVTIRAHGRISNIGTIRIIE